MKKKILLAFAFVAAAVISAEAANPVISPSNTFLFEKRDTCDLYLDIYNPAPDSQATFNGKEKPTILFMFGGGFIRGARNDEGYLPWFKAMTENGYGIISIDYRLGLKGSNKVGVAQVNVLDKAIHMGVEDLFSATAFICDNAENLGINAKNIVIAGSSAGAIIAMQAEYEICNKTSWTEILPDGFRYAGVMSFSGAILSREGKVDYKVHSPAPTLMLHGTSDELVPYKQIAFFNLGFFGGGKLVERFEKFGYNYNMFHFIDYGHEIAGSMITTMDLQERFLQTNVIEGKKRIIEAWISDPDVYKGFGPQSRKELYSK